MKQAITLLLVGFKQCVEYPLGQFVCLPYAVQVKSDGFILNLEALGKLTTALAVIHLYGHLQGFIIQDLQPATVRFIIKGQIFQPEHLEAMSDSVFTHSIILKGLMYSKN